MLRLAFCLLELNFLPCSRQPPPAFIALYSSCKKVPGHSCKNPWLCSLIQVLPEHLTRDLMGFSRLPNHIRGRILVERESHLTGHCAFVISVEHTYVFKQVHAFVDLKITTVRLGKLRPCLPRRMAAAFPGHSLHIQKVELLVAFFVGNLQLCFLLHY